MTPIAVGKLFENRPLFATFFPQNVECGPDLSAQQRWGHGDVGDRGDAAGGHHLPTASSEPYAELGTYTVPNTLL